MPTLDRRVTPRALWLLHSDDAAVRRERGLMLAQEGYRRRIQSQRDLTPTLASVADRQRSRTQLAMLEHDLAAVKAARTSRVEPNVTSIIETAADLRFGNPRLTAEALLEWCRLGGDAHAIGWQLMLQLVTWTSRGTATLSTAAVSPTIGNVAEPYLAAGHMFRAGIGRFDQLSPRRRRTG